MSVNYAGSSFVLPMSEAFSFGHIDTVTVEFYQRQCDEEFVPPGIFLKMDNESDMVRALCLRLSGGEEVLDLDDCRVVLRALSRCAVSIVESWYFLQSREMHDSILARRNFLAGHRDYHIRKGTAFEQVELFDALLRAIRYHWN